MGEDETEGVIDAEQSEELDEQTEGEGESQTEGEQTGEAGGEGEEETVIQIGEAEPPAAEERQEAPQWVKELRQEQKRLKRENAELRAKLGGGQQATPQGRPELPPKPKLGDFDYDEERYDQARDEWDAARRKQEAWDAEQQARAKAAQDAVRQVHESYAKSKAALKVRDFQEAEEAVTDQLSQVQQSIVIAGAANPAAVVYALGRTPEKLRELASIKDPVKFAVALGKLETEVKVTTTKRTSAKPAPEQTIRGGSGSTSSAAETLKRLEAEADRTGDRTKVAAFRKQMAAGK